MLQKRLLSAIAALALLLSVVSVRVSAQGVTTGAIAGTVTEHTATGGGNPVESAQIQVRNNRTGATTGTLTRATGQYIIQGLEPDDNYSITVRRIGYQPITRNNLRVALGQTDREDFQITPQTNLLSAVKVTGEADAVINPTKIGTSTQFNDSTLHRLPSLNRNFVDFVSLVPQVSTTTGSLSGGGVNIRQNAIQIDGAAAGDLFGLGTTGQPGAQSSGKSIPLDAVKEYQVLLSPFDVRQGNFGGLLINAVTKSGTNEFHGSAYGYERGQNLTRKQPYLSQFYQRNYGFALSGPIIPNHLFFFVNPERQAYHTPVSGPDITSPACVAGSATTNCLYIDPASIDQLNNILATKYGFTDAGNGGKILRENPLTNVFGRLDAYLPFNTRAVLRHNYAKSDLTNFGRSSATSASPIFNLTSNRYLFSSKTNSTVAEFFTNLPRGLYNELLVNYTNTHDFRTVPVNFPSVDVRGIPRVDATTSASTASFRFGTENSSQGNALDQRTLEVTENVSIPVGTHNITVGGKDLVYKWVNLFGQNRLGNWIFNTLDLFNQGTASSYQVSAPAPTDKNNGLVIARAHLYSGYLQDVWTVNPTFTLSYGLRADRPNFLDRPPFNQAVWDVYGRSTSAVPVRTILSPRLGFNWDATGDQRNQFRGGVGYYTGVPPFVYLSNAFGNSGLSGFASLTCNGAAGSSTAPPAFTAANIATPPTRCGATGTGAAASIASNANIATVDPKFRFPQYQKWNAAYDHRFGNGMVGTLEGLYTRSISNAFYTNLALAGIQGLGPYGRVMYGQLTATGTQVAFKGNRQQVIDVTNSHGDYTYSLTGQLQKTFFSTFQSSLAYTYSQSRDVTTTTSSTQGSNYRYQRDVWGPVNSLRLQRSKNDQPHKIVATGSWRLKTLTDLSFIYTGNSGSPYDYVYGSNGGTTGDLNADGQSQNDLFYVPTDAHDPTQILFTGYNGVATGLTAAQAVASAAAQADALEKFIQQTPCLRNQRGHIMNRNTCRNPWQNEVDVSVGQSLQAFGRQNLQLRLDILNFGNLLNKKWGETLFSDQGSTCGSNCSATILVTHTATKLGSSQAQAIPVVTFDQNLRRFSGLNASSNYRMQLSLRYSF